MNDRGMSDEKLLKAQIVGQPGIVEIPIVDGRSKDFLNMVVLVDEDPTSFEIPIVSWPISGRRPLDPGTGSGGGVSEGWFTCKWNEGKLLASNDAVGGEYVIGFAVGSDPDIPAAVDLWHLNYHPDGGQLFASMDSKPFLVPVTPPGEDPNLDSAVALFCDGSYSVCLLPGVWHEGVYPIEGNGRFLTRQGRVHGRISADLSQEFGCLLRMSLLSKDFPEH